MKKGLLPWIRRSDEQLAGDLTTRAFLALLSGIVQEALRFTVSKRCYGSESC